MEAVATPLAGKPLFSNKALKKLIFPLVIEQFLAISVGFCDTVMISGLGDEAISGVSLVDMIMTLMINVFAALATGGAVVAAQFIGAKRAKDARNSASQLIFVAFIISIVLMALTLVFKAQLLRLFFSTLEEGVMQSALTYFWISALSFPFLAIYNCCAALFRAMGNSKISMLASLITTIMNIIGNAILIYGVKWGVAGAAISSTISRFAAMLLLLILLHKRDRPIYISIKDKFRPNFGLIKKILSIGIPSSIESSLFHLGRILVVSIITSFGTVQIAANAVANNLDGIGCIPGQAMGLAVITVIGQCVGLGSEEQIRLHTKKLMKLTYLMSAIWNAIILATLPLTLRMYNISPDAYSLALKLIIIHNGCHFHLACFVHHAECPEGCERRQVHDVHRAVFDVHFPTASELHNRTQARHGRYRRLDSDDSRLGVPRGCVLPALQRQALAELQHLQKRQETGKSRINLTPQLCLLRGQIISRHKNEAVFRLPHFLFNYLLPVIFAISSA